MKPSDFTVGQKLVAVYTLNRKDPRVAEVMVTGIGRVWVTYDDGIRRPRFDPEDMSIDGGNFTSPGRVFLSMDEFAQARRRAKLRHAIVQNVSRSRLHGVDTQTLETIAAALGVEIEG